MAGQWHRGRAWTGHDVEDACPCPQEPCGLVSTPDPACPQHSFAAGKSIRQSHLATNCPAQERPMTDSDPIPRASAALAKWILCDDCYGAGEYLDSDGDSFQPALEVVRCWRCDGTGITKERPVELYEALIEYLNDVAFIVREGNLPNTVALTMRGERLATTIVAADERMTP